MAPTGGNDASSIIVGGGGCVAMIPPWLDQVIVAIPGIQHDLPKNPEKFLPKFDPDKKEETPENFVNRFMLSLRLQNVQYEDVVFHLLAYTFQGMNSTRYLMYL